jgi:hypothetical protein
MRTLWLGLVAVVAMTTACSPPAPAHKPTATYDQTTGKLRTLSVDANGNGKVDTVSYMDGAQIVRIEVDQNEDGKVDRWDFYGTGRQLEKVGSSRQNDGVMDMVSVHDGQGAVIRTEVSTRRDGRFDHIEYFSAGRLTRSADDTDGDGRPDKWDEYAVAPGEPGSSPHYVVVATAVDDVGQGRPSRRFVYAKNGAVARVEIDLKGDGHFEAIPLKIKN